MPANMPDILFVPRKFGRAPFSIDYRLCSAVIAAGSLVQYAKPRQAFSRIEGVRRIVPLLSRASRAFAVPDMVMQLVIYGRLSLMPKEKKIPVSEFKAKCLRLLQDLEPDGLLITRRGHPIARVLPVRAADNRKLIGSMRGQIQIRGDIFSTGLRWDAEPRHPHSRRSPRR